jgi:hypothetical protein
MQGIVGFSVYMQIWLSRKSKTFVNKILSSNKTGTGYVCNKMYIDSLQEITNEKFGLTQKALDLIETEKINLSKKKVINYFETLYK